MAQKETSKKKTKENKSSGKSSKSSGSSNTTIVPLLPLREVIIFPHMVVPLFVGREKSINALEECVSNKRELFLVSQKQATTVNPSIEDIHEVGTLGTILQILRLPDNTVKVLVEGKKRARIKAFSQDDRMLYGEVEEIAEVDDQGVEAEALIRSVKATFEEYVKLNKRIPPEMLMSVNSINEPSRLADIIVAHLNLKFETKQELLEVFAPCKRLEKILELIQGEIEILQVEKRIRSRVKKQMERSQKEYYLNEQMQAIQKELGEKDEFKAEVMEMEKQIKALKLSKDAREKALREVKKLKMMSPMSAEATVIRNYIDWIVSLPWGIETEDHHDLDLAEKILEKDHYGLDEVKERILEYLAVRSLTKHQRGQVLCLVGPPGVGKTSLAKSIAESLNKKFVRCSLGGVRDEAEIRGHRRTYVGAMPGKVIQSLKKTGSSNPVFLLDEVDKMSMDFRGDPSAALLEVLDPEQNKNFGDHYLEIEYDLSKVLFVLTANSLHTIPRPLLDRMEVITISGYTEEEKFHIVKRYLLSKQMGLHGLEKGDMELPDETTRKLIRDYTRESGVRNLERTVATVCRKIAKKIVDIRSSSGESGKAKPKIKTIQATGQQSYVMNDAIVVRPEDLEDLLGPSKYQSSTTEEKPQIGLTNGLAYTEVGGDMLQIEVSVVPGKGNIKFTGKLGEVMQESAQTAMSYVRSRTSRLGLSHDFNQTIDIHLHVPEGAVPKDGPSAGITMATAITSALLKIPVRADIAMTGEITLRGRVLQIGGLKEKLLAAKIAGVKTVLIPKSNVPDLKKIPDDVKNDIEIIPVEHADEVLRNALVLDDPSQFMTGDDEVEKLAASAPATVTVAKSKVAESSIKKGRVPH